MSRLFFSFFKKRKYILPPCFLFYHFPLPYFLLSSFLSELLQGWGPAVVSQNAHLPFVPEESHFHSLPLGTSLQDATPALIHPVLEIFLCYAVCAGFRV